MNDAIMSSKNDNESLDVVDIHKLVQRMAVAKPDPRDAPFTSTRDLGLLLDQLEGMQIGA